MPVQFRRKTWKVTMHNWKILFHQREGTVECTTDEMVPRPHPSGQGVGRLQELVVHCQRPPLEKSPQPWWLGVQRVQDRGEKAVAAES